MTFSTLPNPHERDNKDNLWHVRASPPRFRAEVTGTEHPNRYNSVGTQPGGVGWQTKAITGKPASDDLDRMRPIAACALDVEGLTQTCSRRAQVSRKDNIMDGQHQYIGDGVYASFDGWSVVLRANMPTTDTIFLEPEVAWALVEYIKRVYAQPEPESEQP